MRLRLLVLASQPFLVALFPIFSFFAMLSDELDPGELVRPVVIAILSTAAAMVCMGRWSKDIRWAAMTLSVSWIGFFAFGFEQYAVVGLLPGASSLANRTLLLGLWASLAALFAVFARAPGRVRSAISEFLAVAAIAGVAMPAASVAQLLLAPVPLQTTSLTVRGGNGPEVSTPSIYYIILDSYARADVLKEEYGYDNGWFLEELRARGFTVSPASVANYMQTSLSLASSLNLTYLDDVANTVGRQYSSRSPLRKMMADSVVSRFLKQRGYTYVTYSTGYTESYFDSADIHVSAPVSPTPFENLLIRASPLALLSPLQYRLHGDRVLYALDRLQQAAEMKQPVFVLAHLMSPHPPFVFKANGDGAASDAPFWFVDGLGYYAANNSQRADYIDGYREQLAFLNMQLVKAIDSLLEKSAEPPIVILQSDHGPGSTWDPSTIGGLNVRERMAILNAYLLPGRRLPELDQARSPVNTFRALLNGYFDTDLPLLPTRSYFSTWLRPYEFMDVTDRALALRSAADEARKHDRVEGGGD